MNKLLPAIVAVGYNRADCLRRLLTSIEEADYPDVEITLIVSLDRSEKTEELEAMAKEIGWTHGRQVIKTYEERQGLRKHIIQCGDFSLEYGAVIILEDDLIVARGFYQYVLQALCFYGDDERITGVSLYSHAWNGYANYQFMPQRDQHDAYLGQFSISWGQCWTSGQWSRFKAWYEIKEKQGLKEDFRLPASIERWGTQSWGKYFVYYLVEHDLYYVIPYVSLSTNCSDVGEHNRITSNSHQVMLSEARNMEYRFPDFGEAIKYDLFFERIWGESITIHGISADKICMNLNAQHRDSMGRKYILSDRSYPSLKPIKTFGLRLRPIEANVMQEIEGEDLFLYQLSEKYMERLPTECERYSRVKYELYDHYFYRIVRYVGYEFRYKLKRKMKKILER